MELAISIVAVVLSTASLGWQAYTWRTNAPRARVAARITIDDREGGLPVMRVDVTNRGRASGQVRDIEVWSTDKRWGWDLARYYLPGSPKPVVDIAAHSTIEFTFNAAAFARALQHHGDLPAQIRLFVHLGQGGHACSGPLPIDSALAVDDGTLIRHEITQHRIQESAPLTLRERLRQPRLPRQRHQ